MLARPTATQNTTQRMMHMLPYAKCVIPDSTYSVSSCVISLIPSIPSWEGPKSDEQGPKSSLLLFKTRKEKVCVQSILDVSLIILAGSDFVHECI